MIGTHTHRHLSANTVGVLASKQPQLTLKVPEEVTVPDKTMRGDE